MGDGASETEVGQSQAGKADLVLLPDNPPPQGAEVIWYEGRGGMRLRMLYAPEPKDNGVKTRGLAIVCPGRSEFIEKYFEVARDLQERGFAVVIFDWPGQGLSQRQLKNPLAGHIKNFDWYVEALMRGLAKIERRAPKTWVLLSHSMGGAIALEALRARRLTVAAAAFSAPMWGIPIWFFQRWYGRTMRAIGAGAMQARPPQPDETFENNQLTHCESRWQLFRRSGETAEPLSHARYADEVACRSPNLPPARPALKKGLGGWSPNRSPALANELDELGISAVTVNIFNLHQFASPVPVPGGKPFTWQGRTYYAQEKNLAKFDRTFTEAAKRGAMVSAILLIANPSETKDPAVKLLGHPDAVKEGQVGQGLSPGLQRVLLAEMAQEAQDQLGTEAELLVSGTR